MDYLLAWYRLIFFLPLAVGMLFVVGVIVGVTEFHHELDLDGDHDVADSGFLAFIGFGRVPVALIFTIFLLLFGGAGTICNLFLEPLLQVSSVFALGSFAVALAVSFFLTGSVARIIRKYMPTLETTLVTKQDIVGCSGTLLFATEDNSSTANVRMNGDLFQIRVRTAVPMPKGHRVMIINYDDTAKTYDAVTDPAYE